MRTYFLYFRTVLIHNQSLRAVEFSIRKPQTNRGPTMNAYIVGILMIGVNKGRQVRSALDFFSRARPFDDGPTLGKGWQLVASMNPLTTTTFPNSRPEFDWIRKETGRYGIWFFLLALSGLTT